MKVVRTMGELETAPGTGLVPTMGALHEGHRALFRAARAESDRVVASLFVNPAQFDEQADLEAYPRDEAGDLELAEAEGVDVVFAPEELYPEGFATWVEPGKSGAGSRDPVSAARASLNGLEPDYVEVLDLGDAKVLAAAVRVGSTRLIDNVLLEGEIR